VNLTSAAITEARGFDRLGALRAETAAMSAFIETLTESEWAAPSKAPGWRVQDVVAHLGASCHGFFQPSWIAAAMRASDVEKSNDRDVDARRGLAPDRIRSEYEMWVARFLRAQTVVSKIPGISRLKVPLGNLGKYPVPQLVSGSVFDHWTHLAHDLAPALNRPDPETDANRTAVVMEFMLAGLEQMCRESMTWVDHPVALQLDGPGGGTWTISARGGGILTVRSGTSGQCATRIVGRVADFPAWATTRKHWHDCDLTITGDQEYAGRFLDSVNIV
jgi:uncharacterized protein (TIGR03083 family)